MDSEASRNVRGMPARLSRRQALAGGLAVLASAGAAVAAFADPPRVSPRPPPRPPRPAAAVAGAARPPVAELIARAQLGGEVAFVAARTDGDGAELEGVNADRPLAPASISKALTAVYAIEILGADHRFSTRVLGRGSINGSTFEGDIILIGGGDPTLDTDALGDLAAALGARGVRTVTGRFLVHGGALPAIDRIDAAQTDHAGYNPAISGLILNHNRAYFEWQRQGGDWVFSLEARGTRFRQALATVRIEIAQRSGPVYTYRQTRDLELWTVAAAALGNGGGRWLPIRRPERYVAEVIRGLAAAQGINLPTPSFIARVPAGPALLLAEHRSGDLRSICEGMLRFSTNVTAEAVGLAATAAGGSIPRDLAASAGAMSSWARNRAGLRHVDLVDHSGLGDASRLSAADMLRFLRAPTTRAVLPAILREHPIRDTRGRPVPGHPVRVLAKTGTLNFVSTLAGYAEVPGGRGFAFVILSGDLPRRAALGEAARERPPGGAAWIGRARTLQQQLIRRWAAMS